MEKELKPFDKILVRNSNKGYWIPAFYGFKSKDMKHHLTSSGWQDECIPYEGNEEYLGTNKDYIFPELIESEDERISKALIKLVKKAGEGYVNVIDGVSIENAIAWLERRGRQKPVKSLIDSWKEMRLEVWAQASGNRSQNVSTDNTKMFSLNDIDEILEKIGDCQIEHKPAWSEEDKKLIDDTCHLINTLASGYGEKVTEPITFSGTQMIASIKDRLSALVDNRPQSHWKPSNEHYELEEFAKIVRGNLTGISKAVQKLFEAKYLQLTGNKMYGGFKD